MYDRYKHIILYGILLATLVFLLKWLQWRFLIIDNSLDIYIGLIAVFFTILGVWVASQLSRFRVKTVIVEREVFVTPPAAFAINEEELQKLHLTSREYEVLQLIVKGLSNTEIAETLFLSVSTIKTHASNLFFKMDVKSRTQAIEKSKRLRITP